MNNIKFAEILEQHTKWLDGEGGERADLRGLDLRRVWLLGVNLREADLREADLRGVDLRSADLRKADLSKARLDDANFSNAELDGANLVGANLDGAIGNMRELKTMMIEGYTIAYTFNVLQIGRDRYSIEEWRNFDDERIIEMDGDKVLMDRNKLLKFWRKWKDTIFQIIEMSPAKGGE